MDETFFPFLMVIVSSCVLSFGMGGCMTEHNEHIKAAKRGVGIHKVDILTGKTTFEYACVKCNGTITTNNVETK